MYNFIFIFAGEVITLPVPPENLSASIGSKTKSVELVSKGEASILKDMPLQSLKFTFLLPRIKYAFIESEKIKEPEYYLNKFSDMKKSKKPVQFMVTREYHDKSYIFDTDIKVSVENFSSEERAGEEGDFYCSIDLKEFKEVKSVKLEDTGETKDENVTEVVEEVERPKKDTPLSYEVQKGDNLWKIAKRELGDENLWKEIASINNLKNPNKIYPGQILNMPEKVVDDGF